jgi:hypothetical protein
VSSRRVRQFGFAVTVTLSFATGCTRQGYTAQPTAVAPVTTSIIVGGTSIANVGQTVEYTAIATWIPLSPDSAYALLKAVYAKLEIPISEQSDGAHSIGNEVIKARRRFGGMAMEKVVDCGEKLGIRNAETWDMQLNIVSFVTFDEKRGGSTLSTRLQVIGHDPTVSTRDESPCASTGDLELKIGNLVKIMAR